MTATKKKLVQITSPVTFLEATARTAISALSSWKVNVLDRIMLKRCVN